MARDRKGATNIAGRVHRRRDAMADCATQEDQCHPRKIFVGGLAHKTTTQNLRDYFGRYGAIVDAVVLRWPDGRSRGFGYVTFAEVSSATAALRESHKVGGRDVDVKRAVPGTNKLFVGGLPQNATAAELREHFEAFGVVSDAVVMIDPSTNRSRGFGFVCFLPGQEGAAAVAASLERYDHHRIRGKWIEVKSAAPPHKLAAKEGQVEETPSTTSSESLAPSDGPAASPEVLLPPGLEAATSPQSTPQKISTAPVTPPGLKPQQARAAKGRRSEGSAGRQEEAAKRSAEGDAPVFLPWPPSERPVSASESPATTAGEATFASPWSPESATAGSPAFFTASGELQRSLEALLRLQFQPSPQMGCPAMAEDPSMTKEKAMGSPASLAPPGLMFDSTSVSLSKMES